jgi:chromosome segregation ATPase
MPPQVNGPGSGVGPIVVQRSDGVEQPSDKQINKPSQDTQEAAKFNNEPYRATPKESSQKKAEMNIGGAAQRKELDAKLKAKPDRITMTQDLLKNLGKDIEVQKKEVDSLKREIETRKAQKLQVKDQFNKSPQGLGDLPDRLKSSEHKLNNMLEQQKNLQRNLKMLEQERNFREPWRKEIERMR